MILFEIDMVGFAIVEFERDAPRPIDMDRIALLAEAVQGMKVKARNVHFLGAHSNVETIESVENALMHLRIDLRTFALGPKLCKGPAFESPDHEIT
jgi:hypothetical protein